MITTVSTKGQLVLPAELRQLDNIEPGDQFDVERLDNGEYLLRRRHADRNKGLVDLLLTCPTKGWFKPLPRDESTDDITRNAR